MVRSMRIGELASETGATTRALRYYEQQGLLGSRRRANGYREYDAGAVMRVHNIRLLLDAGLTSEDIRELHPCLDHNLDHEPTCAEAIALFEHRLDAVRERVEALDRVRSKLEDELQRLQNGAHDPHATATR